MARPKKIPHPIRAKAPAVTLRRQVEKLGYSPAETAAATGLSVATINRGIRDGTIPSTKFKDRRIVSRDTIDAILNPLPAAG